MDTIKVYAKKFNKKLACGLIALLLIGGVAYAEQLTMDSTATFSRTWVNDSLLRLYNRANSGWETDNIANLAIQSGDIATVVSPLAREFYNIGEWVYSGMSHDATGDLDSTISAGVAFVISDGDSSLHMVVTDAGSYSFTASKDTWSYMSFTGEPYYEVEALGAAQPTTPDNHVLLQKIVTDGSRVTGVTDFRQLSPPNLRIYDNLIDGCVISRDATTNTTLTISAGELELGVSDGGKRINTTTAEVDFTTTGAGGLDTGSVAAGTDYYVYAVPDSTNSVNFKGVASTSSVASTVEDNLGITTTPRQIGWCYTQPAAANISPDSVGTYRKYGGPPNIVTRTGTDDLTTAATDYEEMPGMDARFYSSGRPIRAYFTGPVNNDGGSLISLSMDVTTSTSAKIPIISTAITAGANNSDAVYMGTVTKALPSGWLWFRVYWKGSGNNTLQEGATEGPRVLVVEEL